MYQSELFYQTAVTVTAYYVFARQLMGTVRCFILMLCYKKFPRLVAKYSTVAEQTCELIIWKIPQNVWVENLRNMLY